MELQFDLITLEKLLLYNGAISICRNSGRKTAKLIWKATAMDTNQAGSLANIWRVATIIRFYCYCKITRPIVFPWRFWRFARWSFLWLLSKKSFKCVKNPWKLKSIGNFWQFILCKSYKDRHYSSQFSIAQWTIVG